MSGITEKEYLEAKKTIEEYSKQEQIKKDERIANCKHLRKKEEVSEWHQNGNPDRWRTYCKDCGKTLSS
jgi:hypothetical protein